MTAEFDITMTVKAMRDYRFYHKYTRFAGIMELILGLFLIVFGIFTIGRTQVSYTLVLIVIGSFFLIIMPLSMYFRAASTVKTNKRFKEPTHYVMSKDKMFLSMGEYSQDVSWDMIYKVKETKTSILIYFSAFGANVLPKDQLGDQLDTVKAIIKESMDPYKLYFKKQ